ncbi:ML domain-containing protein [Phyllosticta citriasiana]|uniref:Phosphatidylglycerol/phosphatidylinositol transfer protein n=1 Tax=Phyllosticta citriasiana TaxID=595635 RepID=A0ABR1KXE7_9PEZI
MKVSALFLAVASPLLVSAIDRSNFLGGLMSQNQVTLQADNKVPGENPLFFCSTPDPYILTIDDVDLAPNPPEAGKKLAINAKGTLAQKVEEGAKVNLQVKYGLITLIRQTAELCDYVKEVDLECPLDKGALKLYKEVDLPKEIPPGKYSVIADVVTKDEEPITCLTATVVFSR